MKNSFKIGFLALAIAVTAAACGGNTKTGATDTSASKVDTAKKDTTKAKADTTKKDTAKAKADTTKKK